MKNNPWINLGKNHQIRVRGVNKHHLFWIKDLNGNYGLLIQSSYQSFDKSSVIKLKGIDINIEVGEIPNRLLLILKRKQDWEIFCTLCHDLIQIAIKENDDFKMISGITNRLNRWKKLMQYDLKKTFSIEQQKGLFAELYVLLNVIMKKKTDIESINSWQGPLYGKQDFLFDNAAIEVKSYNPINGEKVIISSKEQLDQIKDKLYLISVGILEVNDGKTIQSIVDEIKSVLHAFYWDLFEERLLRIGYIPEMLTDQLISLRVDKLHFYEVNDEFPKINTASVPIEVEKLEYKINLTGCKSFLVKEDKMKY